MNIKTIGAAVAVTVGSTSLDSVIKGCYHVCVLHTERLNFMALHLTNKVAMIATGAVLGIAVLQGSAQAATLARWNFNSVPADANPATGILTPSTGTGTVSRIGGATGTPPFATAEDGGGSSDPLVGDDSALNTTTYPDMLHPDATALNKSAGVEFRVSTVGQQSIEVILTSRLNRK